MLCTHGIGGQVRTPEQQAAFDTELKDIDLKVEGVQVSREAVAQ
jgi:hypothetical protein